MRDLIPALGEVPLTKGTAAMLDKYYAALRAGEGRARALAPGTIRRIHGILRRALQQGVRWEWLGINPAASASPPRIPSTSVKPPSLERTEIHAREWVERRLELRSRGLFSFAITPSPDDRCVGQIGAHVEERFRRAKTFHWLASRAR